MKRPPSRSGSSKPKKVNNVIPLFPKPEKKSLPKKTLKTNRNIVRKASKRLSIHEKNAKSSISRIKPQPAFGKRIFIGSTIAVGLLAGLVAVAVFSPLLAVKNIEVVGNNRVSAKSILKDLNSLKGKPLPQISSEDVASKLSRYQLIDSVSAVSLPPSTLRVVVVERSAIAIVKINNIAYLYDVAGVQLGRSTDKDQLPVIEHAGNPASSETFKQAISVLLSIPIDLLPRVGSITATSKDNVVLNLKTYGQKILWGDDSQPSLKASVLSALMRHYKNQRGHTFDVSSPNQPSVY